MSGSIRSALKQPKLKNPQCLLQPLSKIKDLSFARASSSLETMRFFLSLAVLCLFAAPLKASETDSLQKLPPHWSDHVFFFVGLDLGYSYLISDVATEINKDGLHLAPKFVVSLQWEPVVIDFAGGWFYNRMEGEEGNPSSTETVITKAGFVEQSIRWPSPIRLEVGLIHQLQFGTQVGYGAVAPDYRVVSMLGVQALYQWETRFPIRAALSVMTDLNISGRQNVVALAGFQIGFRAEEWNKPKPSKIERLANRFASMDQMADKRTRIRLQASSILFPTGGKDLGEDAKSRLKKLADFLVARAEDWKSIEIVGHTDKRGPFDFNQKLSEERAASVLQIFVGFGVDEAKLTSKGVSFTQPRIQGDSETAYRLNRRVEVLVKGLEPDSEFEEVINEMNEETIVPSLLQEVSE